MTHEEQRAYVKQLVAGWKATNAIQDRELYDSLPTLDTATALAQLEDAFNAAILEMPPRSSSELVEQQAWFAKARRR